MTRAESVLANSVAAGVDRMQLGAGVWLALRECEWLTRIPDVVLARIDEQALVDRLGESEPRPLNETEIRVLRRLRSDRPTRFDTLVGSFPYTKVHLQRVVRDLKRSGFVHEDQRGGLVRGRHARSVADRLISVEVKVSAWRPALVQARAHQQAAHAAYVAFGFEYAHRFTKASAHFEKLGVGLLEVDEAHAVTTRVAARRHPRRDPAASWFAAEQVLNSLLGRDVRQLPETRLPGAAAPIVDRAPRLLNAPFGSSSLLAELHLERDPVGLAS